MLTEVCPVVAPDGLDSDRQLNVQRPLEAVPLPRADITAVSNCRIVLSAYSPARYSFRHSHRQDVFRKAFSASGVCSAVTSQNCGSLQHGYDNGVKTLRLIACLSQTLTFA